MNHFAVHLKVTQHCKSTILLIFLKSYCNKYTHTYHHTGDLGFDICDFDNGYNHSVHSKLAKCLLSF